jgi:hypothetical protein
MKFDRAKGGLLKLGGEIASYDTQGNPEYENGVLELWNTEGQIVSEMNGDRRGFDRLNVIHLESENAVLKNVTPTFHGDYDLYVNHIWGVDDKDRGGRTPETAFQSIQFALDQIPKFNEFSVKIHVDDNGGWGREINESFIIQSFTGSGRLGVYLGKRNRYYGMISLEGNGNEIFLGDD